MIGPLLSCISVVSCALQHASKQQLVKQECLQQLQIVRAKMRSQSEACSKLLITDYRSSTSFYAYLLLTYGYCWKTFWEKITHPSKLLEVQQNLSDDQAKQSLGLGGM